LELDCIVPSPLVELGHGDHYAYQLVTKRGTRILWGRAPSAEIVGEATAADKLHWLVQYHRENGSLEARGRAAQLDVRTVGTARQASRTAQAPPGPLK
jgi:hypothetical protein